MLTDGARPDLRDFRVDGWLIRPALNQIVMGETSVRVRPQLIEVLACLAVRPGAVVTKDQLLGTVWSDRHVCITGIARCVAELRQVLADDARRPRIIETIPKRGYRLIARVEHAVESDTRPVPSVPRSASVQPPDDEPAAGACSPGQMPECWIRLQFLPSAAGTFSLWRVDLAPAEE